MKPGVDDVDGPNPKLQREEPDADASPPQAPEIAIDDVSLSTE